MTCISPPAFSTASWMPLTRHASSAGLPKGRSMTRTRGGSGPATQATSVPTTSGLVVAAYSGPW